MAYPVLHITNGPGKRDLEMAFIARDLGAAAKFTVLVPGHRNLIVIRLNILNFHFVTCHGPVYEVGGHAIDLSKYDKEILPPFNFLFVNYFLTEKVGRMEFANGG